MMDWLPYLVLLGFIAAALHQILWRRQFIRNRLSAKGRRICWRTEAMKLSKTRRGYVPRYFFAEDAQAALDGETAELLSAFSWRDTPQGYDFWYQEHKSTRLSPRARRLLRTWIQRSNKTSK